MSTIGRLEILRRYPVKSMRGEDLDEARIAYTGLAGDRVWAFTSPEKKPEFPWHSAREQASLLLYTPRFRDAPMTDSPYPAPSSFAVDVTTPTGQVVALEDPALLSELQQSSGRTFGLRFSEKGMQDARPLSLFGLATLAQLEDETGRPLDHRRFRANFYVRWTEDRPFYEDELVGRKIRIGHAVEVLISKKDPRCVMIGLDPETADADPNVLLTVAKRHRGCAGVYAVVLKEGVVRRDDVLTLLD